MATEIDPGTSQNEPGTETKTETPSTTPDAGQMVNAAVSNHLKRFIEKQLPGLFESALKPIHEKLSAPPQGKPEPEMKKNAEYAALEAKLAEFEKRANEQTARAVAAEKKQREDRAFVDLKGSLNGKVLPEFLDMVSENLFHVKRMVDFEEDGSPVFVTTNKTVYGDEEQRLPIKDGIEKWLKTEAAKAFLPAPSSSGASGKPRSSGKFNPQFDPRTASDDEKLHHSDAVIRDYEAKYGR